MPPFSMSALGDFVRLGPQVYPARPNAVQVIMRGPHGARLAADPVRTREGKTRGSGFRTWIEQLNVPANLAWTPGARVVGLLGMGADTSDVVGTALLGPFWYAARQYWQKQLATSPRVYDSSANQTTGGLPAAAKAAWTSQVLALQQEANRSPARYTEEQLRHADLQLRSGLTSSRWTDSGPGYLPQPKLLEIMANVAADRAERETREDNKPGIAPGVRKPGGYARMDDPQRAFTDSLREDAERARRTVLPAVGIGLGTIALLVAGGVVVYGLAQGYGRGLASRAAEKERG